MTKQEKMIISAIVIAVTLLVLAMSSFGTIRAGQIGIRTRFGAVKGSINQGFYAKLPIIEKVYRLDIKTRTINYDKGGDTGDNKKQSTNLFGASKDLQDVSIGTVVNYRINPLKAQEIFTQFGSLQNYESNVIEPVIRELVKSTASQYTAEELVTKRAEFSDKVNFLLSEQFIKKDAILERFSITNFEFSEAFSAAIEAKVTATQNAEAAKNKLEQVKFEAQQQIEEAKAKAEAIKIQAQAINSQGGADYVNLQAVNKWNGVLPTQMIPGGSVPFLNLNK